MAAVATQTIQGGAFAATSEAASRPVADEAAALPGKYRVVATIEHLAVSLVTLRTAKGEFVTTEEHLIYVEGGGWTKARGVRVGDRLRSKDGHAAVLLATETRAAPAARVFNLTVDGAHTYYVGPESVLVHNTSGNAGSGRAEPTKPVGGPPRAEMPRPPPPPRSEMPRPPPPRPEMPRPPPPPRPEMPRPPPPRETPRPQRMPGESEDDFAFRLYEEEARKRALDDSLRRFGLDRNVTQQELNNAYRAYAREHHPDKGGSAGVMQSLNSDKDAIQRELDLRAGKVSHEDHVLQP